jgi:hypothetical protein
MFSSCSGRILASARHAIRRSRDGAAGRSGSTGSPGTPPLRPRRSSLRRAALPGAGGRQRPRMGRASFAAAANALLAQAIAALAARAEGAR